MILYDKGHLPQGSKVWIYSKIPVGEVCAYGVVDKIIEASPADIWDQYGHVSGIQFDEFTEYFSDREIGCAIVFSKIQSLENNISLNFMREKLDKFHPPQFFKYLYEGSAELAFLNTQA